MPLYEYRCPDCDHRFEKIKSVSQADFPEVCPRCQNAKAERTLSTFSARGSAGPSSSSGCGPSSGGFS